MANSEDSEAAAVSLANKYKVVLAEEGGDVLTEKKAVMLFKVFDQLQPKLGVYSAIFKLIRDHLFDCVYSKQLTGSEEDDVLFLQRLPYFTIVQRIHVERDEIAEELAEKLEVVKETLFKKHKAWEECLDQIEALKDEIKQRDESIENLENDLHASKETCRRLEMQLASTHEAMDRMEYNMKCDIADLKEDLHDAREEIAFLKKFKHGYDQLKSAFEVQPGSTEPFPNRRKKPIDSTHRSNLITSVNDAAKLEEQLLTVQNAIVEEYDSYLEEHLVETSESKSLGESSLQLDMYGSQDFEMDRRDHQFLQQQQRFEKTLDDIGQEMRLLKQHRDGLLVELQNIEPHKKSSPAMKRARSSSKASTITDGLELEEDEDKGRDPFIVNERFFSKYAAMLYTSDDNGRTFHEIKDARYCPSCGEKTIICPHKILKQEHVFTLPVGVSHVKVSRPKVRTLQDMPDLRDDAEESVEAGASSPLFDDKMSVMSKGSLILSQQDSPDITSPLMKPEVSGVELPLSEQQYEGSGEDVGVHAAPEQLPQHDAITGGGATESHLVHTTSRMWEDYRSRTTLERAVPRVLSLPRLLSLLEQFAAHIFWWDDYATEDDAVYSILDFIYKFTEERFVKQDVSQLAAYDFMSAIVHYSAANKLVMLTSHVLIGNYDATVFRYTLLMAEFIDLVEWQTVEDFRAFASVVYPTLTEDDIETLHIGYTSFSENKISKQLVMNYFVHIIIKYREPRFLEMENKLVVYPSSQSGIMTEQEFSDAADAVLSVTNEKLMVSLYREAKKYVSSMDNISNGVPILRLAQIASYLRLLSIHALIRETVAEKVAEHRERPSSGKTASTRVAGSTEKLITMATCKMLSLNISRRQQLKKARLLDSARFQ